MMPLTPHDIAAYRQCPYAYDLDRKADRWRLTLAECMDLSVHDAILEAERRRIMKQRMPLEDILGLYWDSWDRHYPDVYPQSPDNLQMIRFGEVCVGSYFNGLKRTGGDEPVAASISGTVDVGGNTILTPIDSIRRRNKTAVVCNYVTEPILRSADDLISDPLMCLCGKWALKNVAGCSRVMLRWEFLGSGTFVEAPVLTKDIESAESAISELMERMDSDGEILPHESEHCSECPYKERCPRFLHELSLPVDLSDVRDDGVSLVDEYSELQEKIDALKQRQRMLETKQEEVGRKIAEYSRRKGYMSLVGTRYKVLVRTDTKVILPENKDAVIARLRETGQYDGLSMVNYPRLRSDIAKGVADPEISRMAEIQHSDKLYMRKRGQ